MDILQKALLGYKHLIIFTTYYFSLGLLLQTFFTPRHRYTWHKKRRGIHLEESLFVLFSNILSTFIGMLLRTVMIAIAIFAVVGILLIGFPVSLFISVFDPHSSIFNSRDLLKIRALAYDWHFGYTPTLDPYALDLYEHPLKFPFVGRAEETTMIVRTLQQKSNPNLLLVGEPGSGRNALITFVATTLVTERFLVFDHIAFLKNKKQDAEKEGALEEILEEAAGAGNVILVIPYFEEFLPYTNTLARMLADNRLRLVGMTNKASYNRDILPNKQVMKYLTTLEIPQLSRHHIEQIIKQRFHFGHKLHVSDIVVTGIVEASYQLVSMEGKNQPGAAMQLLEEFMGFYKQDGNKTTQDTDKLLQKFLENRLKVPHGAISPEEKEKLKHLEYFLHQWVVDQEQAIGEIARALRRRRLELSDATKPIGTFLFLGPTGVGKTATAKALSAVMFEDEKKLIRFDMSRYQEPSQVGQLIDELAAQIRSQPYGVLLLDEFEKANQKLRNIFLTIFDEGYFTDTHGQTVLCNNVIIIATSNAGSEFIRENVANAPDEQLIAAISTTSFQQELIDYILRNNLFTPELLNRFDAVVAYTPLSKHTVREIIERKLKKLNEQLEKKYGKSVPVTNELLDQIARVGTKEEFGAREIDRAIKRIVEDEIAEELLG